MFTIVISEKGGAERREAFDKTEISVGRIQGNDLVLPKGNVSKHHARLLSRDGRFIVTDLKSTNGTYVNGRKTSQATIVREGDKIYVGDFVLRIETGQGSSSAEAVRSDPVMSRGQLVSGHDLSPEIAASPPPLAGSAASPSLIPSAPDGMPSPSPYGIGRPVESQRVSHYPLERDPDSESHPELVGVPVPPPPPAPRVPQSELRPPRPVSTIARGAPGPALRTQATTTNPARASGPSREMPRETPAQAARRVALVALANRVSNAVDPSILEATPARAKATADEIERVVHEQAGAMRANGELPETVDIDVLCRDMVLELAGLGPLTDLLDDVEVSEIHVVGTDRIFVRRNGATLPAEPSFTSDRAVVRVLSRLVQEPAVELAARGGAIERRLPTVTLTAIGPPVSSRWVLTIRRLQSIEATLQGLTSSGALSRSMATFLEACVGAHANLLVVGHGSVQTATLLAALASVAGTGERIAVVQDEDELVVSHGQVLRLSMTNRNQSVEELLRATTRMGVTRVAIATLAGELGPAVLDAIGDGRDGVSAGIVAPSLRQGLARLASRVARARPTGSAAMAGEAIGVCFDVAIEVGQAADGKLRVSRIAELDGVDEAGVSTRDLFISTTDGGGQTTFAGTGNTPRIVEALAARGIRLDATMFRRAR